MIFDQILTESDQILIIYIKFTKYMSKIPRDVIFSEKKSPCGNANTPHRGWGGGVLGYWGGIGVLGAGYWGKKIINELILLLNAC